MGNNTQELIEKLDDYLAEKIPHEEIREYAWGMSGRIPKKISISEAIYWSAIFSIIHLADEEHWEDGCTERDLGAILDKLKCRRIEFLNHFLSSLGAESIKYLDVSKNRIRGTVVYDEKDPEEQQNFCWNIEEEGSPSEEVVKLAKLLNEECILNVDKITVERSKLLKKYNKKYGARIDADKFNIVMDNLMSVEVTMVDEGKATDIYFIHE